MAAAAEVMVDKLRWERRAQEERDGEPWSEEVEWEYVQAKTVYNEATGSLDFAKRRVTDMKTCRRITVPEPGKGSDEVVFANLKARAMSAAAAYKREHCDKAGNVKQQNLTDSQKQGLQSLKRRVGAGELVICPTDKSGRLAVYKTEDYVTAMQPHVQNDPVISLEEKKTLENVLNGHSIQLGRILRIGEAHNHGDRVKQAMTNHSPKKPD